MQSLSRFCLHFLDLALLHIPLLIYFLEFYGYSPKDIWAFGYVLPSAGGCVVDV
jgi:hypothetical protein